MTSKHTPGPWIPVAVEGGWDGVAENENRNSVICALRLNNPANVRLIAAAPELLEACQTFAEWLRREAAGSDGQPWAGKRDTPEGEAAWSAWWYENLRICDLAQEQVRAAIAKATEAA